MVIAGKGQNNSSKQAAKETAADAFHQFMFRKQEVLGGPWDM